MSIIFGQSFDEYSALPGINNTALRQMSIAPARYRYEQDNPPESTAAQRLGRLVHLATLEPVAFAKTTAVAPDGIDRRTKEGKAAWAAFEADSLGKAVITADEASEIAGIAASVQAHPAARAILDAAGDQGREVSATWTDAETGEPCKARADIWSKSVKLLSELKTTSYGAGPEAFAKAVATHAYHQQSAWYLDGWAANGEEVEGFAFIAVERDPPYLVAVYQLDASAIEQGRATARAALTRLIECRRTNRWPGYSEQIEPLFLPKWAVR